MSSPLTKLRGLHKNELARAIVIVILLSVTILGLLQVGILTKPAKLSPEHSAEIKLPRVQVMTLSDFRAADEHFTIPAQGQNLTLINLFASWCKPCQAEWPLLRRLSSIQGLNMVGIVTPSDRSLPDFLEVMGDPFDRIGLDDKGVVPALLKASGMPETFVINSKGEILLHRVGPLIESDISKIEKLADKAPNAAGQDTAH